MHRSSQPPANMGVLQLKILSQLMSSEKKSKLDDYLNTCKTTSKDFLVGIARLALATIQNC